jgi:hypothetical protein
MPLPCPRAWKGDGCSQLSAPPCMISAASSPILVVRKGLGTLDSSRVRHWAGRCLQSTSRRPSVRRGLSRVHTGAHLFAVAANMLKGRGGKRGTRDECLVCASQQDTPCLVLVPCGHVICEPCFQCQGERVCPVCLQPCQSEVAAAELSSAPLASRKRLRVGPDSEDAEGSPEPASSAVGGAVTDAVHALAAAEDPRPMFAGWEDEMFGIAQLNAVEGAPLAMDGVFGVEPFRGAVEGGRLPAALVELLGEPRFAVHLARLLEHGLWPDEEPRHPPGKPMPTGAVNAWWLEIGELDYWSELLGERPRHRPRRRMYAVEYELVRSLLLSLICTLWSMSLSAACSRLCILLSSLYLLSSMSLSAPVSDLLRFRGNDVCLLAL